MGGPSQKDYFLCGLEKQDGLHKNITFSSDRKNKMAARGDYFFWLAIFKDLLLNYWAKCDQTLREWCMGVPSQKYNFLCVSEKQDGGQRRFFFSDWPIFNRLLLLNYWTKCYQTWQEWCMCGPSRKYQFLCRSEKQDGHQWRFFFLIGWFSNVFYS